MQAAGAWMRTNLTTQGYCLTDAQRRDLAVGLRFSTGLCLALVVVALALESPSMLFVLSGIGLVAGFAARHPCDYLWTHGVRRALGGPALPPNPPRRRHAFKIATGWLVVVGILFAVGAPSEALAWWERRAPSKHPVTT
jgi:Domain of unknown function (DUF4395)